MEKNRDSWSEISRLIGREKEAALAEFRSQGFNAAAMSALTPTRREPGLPVRFPVLLAAAASLLLAVGLAFFVWRQGSWRTAPADAGAGNLLADSFLYSEAGRLDAGDHAAGVEIQAGPYFTAWAEAALGAQTGGTVVEEQETAPRRSVEHGDPEKLRRAIGRAIRENMFERILVQIQELHAKEA